jgi:activator of HSP90 ATPase
LKEKYGMETKTIEQSVTIHASAHDIYEAYMDSDKHYAFTGDDADISREVGGRFTAYSGYIEGENLELVPDKKIVQSWRGSDWPKGHYSRVSILLEETGGVTTIIFTQTGVPEEFYNSTARGWREYYWVPLKEMLEK